MQRTADGTCTQAPTIAELCRLARISRNSIYRYHPRILEALRQHRTPRPANAPGTDTMVTAAPITTAAPHEQITKLAALVDHYYAAYREVRALLDRREHELAELRRQALLRPTPIQR
jgi:hypothetical protein